MSAVHEHVADDQVMAVALSCEAPTDHKSPQSLEMAEELRRILGYDPDNPGPWWGE